MLRYVALFFLIPMASGVGATPLPELLQAQPESWEVLDPSQFNDLVEAAIATDAIWPRSPLETTLRLIRGDLDVRELVVWEVKNAGEAADKVRIHCIRDGLMDDALRGTWHRFDLSRRPDGTWRVERAVVACRCWRSEDQLTFGDFDCP